MTQLNAAAGSLAIGAQFATREPPPPPTKPMPPMGMPSATSMEIMQAAIADMAKRLGDLQQAVSLKVDRDRILSGIWVTPEAVLIASDKVAVVGEVTFADWQRDISGQAIGNLDPSITQIRGGVIKTGKVMSFDGQSYIDLDAVGSQNFIQSHASVLIEAGGNFSFGEPGKALTWNGVDLAIGGNALLGTTPVGSVVIGSINGTSALAGLAVKLNNNAANVMQSGFYLKTNGWDTGNGMAMYDGGIVAQKGGVNQIVISSTGDVTISGNLSGATGTFAGDITTSGHVYATGLVTNGGYTAAIYGNTAAAGVDGVVGISTYKRGVVGVSSSDVGVHGISGNPSTPGLRATSLFGNSSYWGLDVQGYMTINSTSLVSNLNADLLDGYHASQIVLRNQVDVEVSTDGGATWAPVRFR